MLFLVKSLLEKGGGEGVKHKKWGHTKQGSVRLPSTLYDCWTAPVPASPGFIPCTMNDECIIWRGRHIKTATIWTKVFLPLGLLTCCMSNHVALFMTEVLIRSWHVCLTATQTLRESSTWMDRDITTFNVSVWIFPYCPFINMQLFILKPRTLLKTPVLDDSNKIWANLMKHSQHYNKTFESGYDK